MHIFRFSTLGGLHASNTVRREPNAFFFCHASRQQLWKRGQWWTLKRTTLNCFSLPTLHMSTIVLQIQDSFSPAPHISSGFVEFFANDFNRCADARHKKKSRNQTWIRCFPTMVSVLWFSMFGHWLKLIWTEFCKMKWRSRGWRGAGPEIGHNPPFQEHLSGSETFTLSIFILN